MGNDPDSGPFTLPESTLAGLGSTLFALVVVVFATAVMIAEFRREPEHHSRWRAAVAAACAVGVLAAWYAAFQPVTMVRDGVSLDCAYSNPTFDIARMRGVPDDSVLVDDQLECRSRARTLLGVEISVAGLCVLGLAGTAVLTWRRRPVTVQPNQMTS